MDTNTTIRTAPDGRVHNIEAGLRLPIYEAPQIATFTDEDILEELGPAQAVLDSAANAGTA